MVSPPATVLPGDIAANSYLFFNTGGSPIIYSHGLGLWDFKAVPDYVYYVTPRGWGEAPTRTVDVVPAITGQEWHGLRVNLELAFPWLEESWAAWNSPVNNIQTFLVVQGGTEELPAAQANVTSNSQAAQSSGALPLPPVQLEGASLSAAKAVLEAGPHK